MDGVMHVTAPGMHTCGSVLYPACCGVISLLERGVLKHISRGSLVLKHIISKFQDARYLWCLYKTERAVA